MEKPKPKPKKRFWRKITPGINSKFKDFISERFQHLKKSVNSVKKELDGDLRGSYENKLQEISEKLSTLQIATEKHMDSIKSYTAEGKDAFEQMYNEISALSNKVDFLVETNSKSPKELYLLNMNSEFESFNGSMDHLFFQLGHSRFKDLMFVIIAAIFILLPFLNIISMILGISLVTKKDYRSMFCGIVILGLFIAQVTIGVLLII